MTTNLHITFMAIIVTTYIIIELFLVHCRRYLDVKKEYLTSILDFLAVSICFYINGIGYIGFVCTKLCTGIPLIFKTCVLLCEAIEECSNNIICRLTLNYGCTITGLCL